MAGTTSAEQRRGSHPERLSREKSRMREETCLVEEKDRPSEEPSNAPDFRQHCPVLFCPVLSCPGLSCTGCLHHHHKPTTTTPGLSRYVCTDIHTSPVSPPPLPQLCVCAMYVCCCSSACCFRPPRVACGWSMPIAPHGPPAAAPPVSPAHPPASQQHPVPVPVPVPTTH